MSNPFVISDTHFYHENILTFKDTDGNLIRGNRFSCAEEMNELIVDNWNKTVGERDTVYHLGDVAFGKRSGATELIRRLKGRKRLIMGNHDDVKQIVKDGWFQKVYMWRQLRDLKVLLTHVPVHESALEFHNLVNIHGHIHQNLSPEGRYINVSVEAIDYTPVAIEECIKDYHK